MSIHVIDDRDPLIVYSGTGWWTGGETGEWNSTTTFTQRAGSTAMLSFHGVSVAVYGTIGSSNFNRTAPVSSYTIDGNQIATFEPQLSPEPKHLQRFFRSPPLPNGRHTLIVTSLRNNCDPLLLDYFVVGSATASSSTTSTTRPVATSESSSVSSITRSSTSLTPTSSRTSITLISSTTTLASSSISSITLSSSPTATSPGNSVQNRHVSTATLAISISAAITTTILLITFIYFFLARRRRRLEQESNANVVSTFWGDSKPVVPDVPTSQIASSNNSDRLHFSRSTYDNPPRYKPQPF